MKIESTTHPSTTTVQPPEENRLWQKIDALVHFSTLAPILAIPCIMAVPYLLGSALLPDSVDSIALRIFTGYMMLGVVFALIGGRVHTCV